MSTLDYISVLSVVNAALWGVLVKLISHWANKIERSIEGLSSIQTELLEIMTREYVRKDTCKREHDLLWTELRRVNNRKVHDVSGMP